MKVAYTIADEQNQMLTIQNVNINGELVEIQAVFRDKDTAERVLAVMEKKGSLTRKNHVATIVGDIPLVSEAK